LRRNRMNLRSPMAGHCDLPGALGKPRQDSGSPGSRNASSAAGKNRKDA
jgi:hypothetical protein